MMKDMVSKPIAKTDFKVFNAFNTIEGDKTNRQKSCVVLPQRYLALMSLSMGFILIWISMMASVLVSNTFKDNVSAKQTLHVFQTHKQMARIVFSIGHEMVSTVDWLVSIESKPRSRSLTIEEAIGITWKMTDSVIADVRRVCNDEELPKLLTLIEFKLSKIRSNEVFVGQNPLKIIKSYDTLFEAIERKSFSLDFASNPSTVKPDIQTSITYPLFIKGMAKRFSELSLGTVFVRSDITINKSDYYYYHFISKHLIDSAFQLNPRVQNRYFELQDSDGTSEVLVTLMDDNLNRRDNHLANLYLNSVKNEIAILLRARDFLNTSVSAQVTQSVTLNDRVLAFHVTIAVIAVFAVILSLTLLCSAFGYKQNKNVLRTDTNGERNDNTVYSIEFDDKVQIFGTNSSK